MLTSFAIRVEVECEACWAVSPVVALAAAQPCRCGAAVSLPSTLWCEVLPPERFVEALDDEEGLLRTQRFGVGRVPRAAVGRRAPRCPGCGAAMPTPAGAGELACPGCARGLHVRAADDLARALDARAQLVIEPAEVSPGTTATLYLLCAYTATSAREARWVDEGVRTRDAAAADLTAEQFARLAADASDDVRAAVARNEACPADVLTSLAADPQRDVRVALVRNRACPSAVVVRLAHDGSDEVRRTLATQTRDPAVLIAIAQRSKTHDDIALAVARNTACPAEALAALARHRSYTVRVAVVRHAATPAASLAQIAAREEDSDVQRALTTSPRVDAELVAACAGAKADELRMFAARHALTSDALLLTLASDRYFRVRALVAARAGAPYEALEVLARDSDSDVRAALVKNPVLTPVLLAQLGVEPD